MTDQITAITNVIVGKIAMFLYRLGKANYV